MAAAKTRKKSSSVIFERISPNSTKPRTSSIRRLTPHCVAGNLTIESTLGLGRFVNPDPKNGASCNYAIGTDGRCGLGVDETDRSWCSSSRVNDMEAITFEIANNGTGPDWRMSDAAINSWLDLAVEICQFYGFKNVNYVPKPDNISVSQVETWIKTWAKKDEMIITLHCWFTAKECPGPYFIRQLPWLVNEMNKRLQNPKWEPEAFLGEGAVQPSSSVSAPAVTPFAIKGDEDIWNYFKGKKLNDFANAGLMGNLFAESGLISNNLQNTFNKSLNMTNEQYTAAVDDGSYINFVNDSAGYGLAQWTFHTRKQALLDFAKNAGKSIGDLSMQLDFLWQEMQGYKNMRTVLDKATTVHEASDVVLLDFERPADQSEAVKVKRAGYGQGYFNKYACVTTPAASSTPTTGSSKIKEYTITITASALNIRSGPGVKNNVVCTLVNDKNTYTIVEEVKTSDGATWGRLKSGIGWLNLEFTKKK